MSAVTTVYELATGRILRVVRCPADMIELQNKAGEGRIDGVEAYPHTHYVAAGVLTARPACPVTIDKSSIQANGIEDATLSNVPADTWVLIEDPDNAESSALVTDGVLDVTVSEVGIYTIVVSPPWPMLPEQFVLEGT